MNLDKIKDILGDQPKFRFKQVYQAIFNHFIESWDEASNLPKDLREKLNKEAPLDIDVEFEEAKDGKTVKALINFDGDKIESVLMRHKDKRNTVCVSSQVGCAFACEFCLTGTMGLKRSLSSHEIVEQVLVFSRYLKKHDEKVTNIVFMGMGEPLSNYEEVMKAIDFLHDPETFNIGARKISISTVGVIDGINKLATNPLQINLAVSLHAPNDSLRNKLMPISRTNTLPALMKSIREYIQKTHRKVMIEYLMLKGINDTEKHAKELIHLIKKDLSTYSGGEKKRSVVINLISYNDTDRFKSSSPEMIKKFRNILERDSFEVVQRYKFGRDIKGACGQLASKK